VFCQLEVLRHCLPASIRQTLDRLPKSLDETYLRVLNQIAQVNQPHAHRMLQCLVVAARPLHVEELAELLAFEFDDAQGGIPKHRAAWRLDDRMQAVLTTCSSLVTIIDEPLSGCEVVQFSHFSVKEFLISKRLASSLVDLSRYHIRLESAHTILTQACLGSLLHLDHYIDEDSAKGFPLTNYAAQHWVNHAQFEDVASHVKVGMETLFDPDKPHFATWIRIHDIDEPFRWSLTREIPTPLYYSALCGFYDLVQPLVIKHPQYVNAIGGRYDFPLLAALCEDHFEVAELLIEHGANADVRDMMGKNILLKALSQPQHNLISIVKFLLKCGVDVNARDNALGSSLHLLAEYGGDLEVAQMLVNHEADVNSRDNSGKTPFHIISESRINESDILNHALLLLKHGAEVNSRDKDDQAPIHLAIERDRFKLAQLLLEHGADANAEDNNGRTPLHLLSERHLSEEPDVDVLNHDDGVDINEKNEHHMTPSHPNSNFGPIQMAQALLKHGANVNAGNNGGKASGEYHL
jgi:ankyrin repeat protein